MSLHSDSYSDSSSDAAADDIRSSAEVRRRLLEVAVTVFGERGFESARVSDIARQCGLTTGAIYSRWRNKRELFIEALDFALPQATAAKLQKAQITTAEKCTGLSSSLLSPENDPIRGLMLEAYSSARRDTLLREDTVASLAVEVDALANLITEGKVAGIVDETLSTKAIALCCEALAIGIHLVMTSHRDGDRLPPPDEWNALIGRFINAIAPVK